MIASEERFSLKALRGLRASGTTVSGRFSVLVVSRDTDTLGGVDVVLLVVPAKKVCFRCVLASATVLGVSDKPFTSHGG